LNVCATQPLTSGSARNGASSRCITTPPYGHPSKEGNSKVGVNFDSEKRNIGEWKYVTVA
jgi:hypothetical protein